MKAHSGVAERILLPVARFEQPDDVTCGPTCLAKVYSFYGYDKPLEDIIIETPRNRDGGTLAVNLGISALRNGFRPTIYPFGLRVFDPSWWHLSRRTLARKLAQRAATARSKRERQTVTAYISYLKLRGRLAFREPATNLLVTILRGGDPILTGLSATYLYGTKREYRDRYDDIRGEPVGHFVVVCGYYPKSKRFVVVDPFTHVPLSKSGRYSVKAERLIAAILLGDVTYDANLLVLGRRGRK